jgi:hypothetical protein
MKRSFVALAGAYKVCRDIGGVIEGAAKLIVLSRQSIGAR